MLGKYSCIPAIYNPHHPKLAALGKRRIVSAIPLEESMKIIFYWQDHAPCDDLRVNLGESNCVYRQQML